LLARDDVKRRHEKIFFDIFLSFGYNVYMGTIDEVKEILNTLRIAMSILFGMIVVLTGSLVKRYDTGNTDTLFWLGICLMFVFMFILVIVVRKIAKKTKEIKEL